MSQHRPQRMTQAELDADAKAAEEAAKVELAAESADVVAPVVEPTPAPIEEPAPVVEETKVTPEVNPLQVQVDEKESRIAELTKKLRDEDGRRGGELTALRTQVDKLGDQLRDLMAENRQLRQQKPVDPPAPPEPDELATAYPDLARGLDKRTKPISDMATKAQQEAESTKAEIQKLREEQRVRDYNGFLASVKKAVPKMEEINNSPDFLNWLGQRIPGTPYTRQQALDASSSRMNSDDVVELFHQYEQLNPPQTEEPPKGPVKPTKEGQVSMPKSGGEQPKAKEGPKASRIVELETKLYRLGTASKEDRNELEKLYDAQARGELT